MILDLVRMKVNTARSKIVSIVITTLISGLLVSIPVPANAADCVPTSTIVGGDTVLTFTTVGSCDWTVPVGLSTADVLVVGGGGAGGTSSNGAGGGGGGGHVNAQPSLSISGTITIQVGAGGVAQTVASATSGGNGGTSSFTRSSGSLISANGGSGGASVAVSAVGSPSTTGYNGGGGSVWASILSTTNGSNGVGGYKGGSSVGSASTANNQAGGGGGGSGGNGSNALTSGATNGGAGGVGVSNSYSGSATFYGGGGGGGKRNASTGTAGSGGSGGGGTGGKVANGANGTANTGGGGGGAGGEFVGGAGGSGVVIVRYSPPANTSLVTFNSNGGTDSDYFAYQATGTSSNLPDRTSFLRTGFEFVGWNSAANGSGTPYALGGAITISANTTLYAQWSRITNPSCAANVGKGGIQSTTLASTKAGNGCVAISFSASGVNSTVTFNYTGANQSWTVPTGVTSASFYLFGAGGGGNTRTSGGGGGYATGAYSVTAGQVYTIIVGEGGGAETAVTVAGLTGKYTKITYGGGGRGGSTASDTYIGTFASGGGRSAIRAPGASTDLATAAGGGGGGYGVCGNGGGGLTGAGARGGTQTAGGASASPSLSGAAGNGSAYRGGDSNNEGGGGGGGFFGGGDGGDNAGGGGGSSYIALLTNGATTSGSSCSGALAETVGIGNIITYNANSSTSGTIPNEAIVPGGTALTASANTGTLARTNYTFSGWNTAANGSGTTYAVGSTTFIPTSNTTLYAQWSSTITYDANGGTGASTPTSTVAKGSTNTTLANRGNLAKAGATFSGWNTAANGTGTRYADGLTTYVSTGSITLYAQWTTPSGTPTLDVASDLGSSSSDKVTSDNTPTINIGSLVNGASVTLTATPASGSVVTCTFTASSTTGSCTFPTMADGTYSITSTQTYNGGTSAVSAALTGVVIDATRPTVTLTSSQIVSGGNRTATPGIPPVSVTVTVTFSESVSGLLISEITKNAESTGWAITTTSFTNAAISSINFVASNTTGAGGTAGIAKFSVAAGVASDVAGNTNTATASEFIVNTLIQLTLSNQYQQSPLLSPVVGGSGGTIAQTTPGQAITLPGQLQLSRVGHTFAGWSLVTTGGNGEVVGATYTPTVPVVLYSSWTTNTYVVTYNANGGNGSPTAATQNYTFGSANLALTTKGTLARTGYTFSGWNTLATGLGTNYLESASYKPTASIILYAKWTAGTFTLTYNANGGTTNSSTSITAGTAVTLSTTAGTRAGYTLAGWNTATDGSGTSYPGATSQTFFANTTLYGLWTPAIPGAPSVTATSAGNTTATVTVTGAAVSGTTAGPATSYSVQTFASDGTTSIAGKTCTVLASASPLSCQITGLTNGTTYKFKATAINTTGSSTSAISTVTATPAPFVVTYSLNSGTLATTTANFNLGTPLTLPLPTRSGYTFAGWHSDSGLSTLAGNDGSSYSPNSTLTLYAKWTGVAYTITYNGNGNTGGSVPASGTYTNGGSAYSVVDNTGVLVKTGYTFASWYTNSTGTGGTAYAAAASYNAAANITLFAKWNPVARTVTYNLNSGAGTIPTQLTGRYIGDTFSTALTTGFSRTGFSFTGWSDGANIYAANTTYTVGGSDVVLTAQWAAVSYSVTFISNGATSGAAPTQANLTAGQTFTTPANPFTKTGYTFAGWNDGTSTYLGNVTYTMTAANTVLVAQWAASGYSITYNGNTHDGGSAPTTGSFVTGSPAYSVALNTFTKTGHMFTGWKTAADGTGTAYAPGTGYSTTADLVLYAQWSAKSISVTYNLNGGTGTTPSPVTWTYNTGSPVTLPSVGDLLKAGYTFGGWATSASATTGITTATPSSDNVFYAVWALSDLAVNYTAGAGTGTVSSTTAKMGTTFTLAASTGLTPPVPSGGCVTYTFATWAYNTATYKEGASFVMGSAAVTFEAQWTCVFNVRYTLNGGTGAIADVQKADGNAITIGAAPTRNGYTFANWVDQSGASWAPGVSTTVTSTRYLFFAVWTATPRTVTYALNGGSGTEPTGLTGQTIGQIFSTATTSSTKAGYTFGGWNDGATNYPAGSSYSINLANVTLTAVWNPATYSITYNGNGATGGATPSNGTFTTGGSYSIPANSVGNLAKTGFTFAGWATAANGGGTSYADAATTLTTTSDVILYAKWSAASYAVTYVLNGATSEQPTQSAVQYGSTFTLAAAATQAGKNFIGWSDGTNTYGGGATYTMGTVAITLTASWQDQVYAITYALNGGSGTAPAQSGLANGGTFTVATTTSTKAGYTFAGWNNGTSNVSAGATYSMTANNVTLTAVWTIAAPAAPSSVSAAVGDGSATVTVAASTSSSSGTPTSYVVTASPGTGTCTVIAPATSCVILGLTNGTAYTFSATATNSTGTSSAATSAAVTPAGKPDAPTGVIAIPGNGSATVSFTAPTITGGPAIVSYTVTASPNGATCTVNAPATSCVVPGLANGTAYTFAVTANNGLFTSSASTASSSVVPATVPGAPTSVAAASTTSGSATITFTAPTSDGGSAITGYAVTSSPAGAVCTGSGTTYTCTGLTNGIAYTFAVVAINGAGNSVAGTSSSLTTQGAASAPSTISAIAGDGQATVSFSGAAANGSTITTYTVQAYDSTGEAVSGATCTVTTATTSGSCIVTGLTNGSSYTFKAVTNSTANGSAVSSGASIPTSGTVPAKAPEAPSGLEVTAGTGRVTVNWTEPASNGSVILSYTIQAYDAAGNAVTGATCTATAPATTCDVSANLVAGTNYTFKATATNAIGNSSASSASTSIAINAAPSVPINVTAVASNASATISWDPPININGSAVIGYTVTAYTAENNSAGTCSTSAPTETCAISGLTNGLPYTFKVTSTNGIGTSASSLASSAVTPSTIPNPPTSVIASMGDERASVSFLAPANNGGSALLSYTVTSSPGSFTCTVNAPGTSCNVTGLTNGTSYTFTVQARNINGESLASTASASGTPVASSRPSLASESNQPTGNPYVGSTLTSNVLFNGAPTPTVTYQWKVCEVANDPTTCTNITGATSSTYTPTISELGKFIVVAATASNGVGDPVTETSIPTLVIEPEIVFTAPSPVPGATAGTAYVLSTAAAGGVGTFAYTVSNGTLPAGLTLDPATGQIAGTPTTAGTYTFTVRATDSNGVYKDVVITIVVAAAAAPAPIVPTTPTTPAEPQPVVPTCDANCQSARDTAATKAAADKAAADAIAKATAEKAAADAAVAAKKESDIAATTASTKANADAAAAAAAAKAAVDKAAAAAVAQAAADAAAAKAAADAAAAKAAQATAAKAAADAAAALKNSTTTAAAKAAATKSANNAAAAATAAVKAAATAASDAAKAKTTAANATKQVDIAINSLNSKTAASQASAQANAIAAAAKAAANDAAAAAATKAAEAKATATTAQKAASDNAARIATEQKQAADAAALAKIAADAAVKATAEKVAAVAAATKASQDLATVLAEKATLAEQAAKATDQTARAEIQKKIDEVSTKVEEVQKTVEAATTKADAAVAAQEEAVETAEDATEEAQIQADEAVEVKAESVVKIAAATKATAAATVAAKVATAAKAAAAKVPSKAIIVPKASTSTSKNSAKATVTGLKPGQKVKVTVNVKPKP